MAHPGDIPCVSKAQERVFKAHVLTITGLNHIIKMVIYPTQERDDDVVDPEHRDDDFEDVGQRVD